jgi:YVTN family beta-propeller protein
MVLDAKIRPISSQWFIQSSLDIAGRADHHQTLAPRTATVLESDELEVPRMICRLRFTLSAIVLVTASLNTTCADEPPKRAGATDRGFLLPNGWTITPAGAQVPLTDLPLNILTIRDGRYALVATNGFNDHELSLIDLSTRRVVSKSTVRQSWFGLAFDSASDRIWWAGGGSGALHRFLLRGDELAPVAAAAESAAREKGKTSFRGGLTLGGPKGPLYALDINAGTISSYDHERGALIRTAPLGGRPYDVVAAPNGSRLYVSDWAGRAVLALDPGDLRVVAKIAVGEHPNQIVTHPSDDRLFVACASSNSVSVIDSRRGIVTETIGTSLFPRAPEGSTPDALAIAPDGQTLYAANADNNCVAVIDISTPDRSQVKGFIPTGWYPTALATTPDGNTLLVGVGKGNQTKPNPYSKELADRIANLKPGEIPEAWKAWLSPYPYIGMTLSGALSIVPVPDDTQLAAYTEAVYRNCPYSDKLLSDAPNREKTAIPTKVGDPSPIKYVIYIIKENRTYDQVFGDLARGDGDPSLTVFGREVTPNHHKLAEEFVLLDNLYCSGHVSADGHPWSTMAYATDYIARNWAITYSLRPGIDDDDEENLANAPSGYLWDACARAGLTYRSYGEYGRRVSQKDGSFRMDGAVPGLVGHTCPDFGLGEGPLDRDTTKVDIFLKEFRQFERRGNLPRFIVMSLGEDHTFGTKTGAHTPKACVASNDLALGRLVEAVSKSRYWPETAIFVIEDDAQNGPDHVDAHRTVGLVVSPYTKRKHLDSTQYQTVSMVRTIELILGLAPLSQHDAAAKPMFASFTDRPDLTPYKHEAARIDLEAWNSPLAYGADRSNKMDFSAYDKVNDFELNEILWYELKGPSAPQPPAVRRAIAYRRPEVRP